eukprot:s199_g25.t3
MFFATFTSTLALGEHIKESTNGLMGLNEYLMMNSAAGMLHSIIGCQPLLVLRPTGPITLLFEKLLMFANEHSLPFWPFFAWTGIFVGLLMFLIAAFELSKYVKYLTLFTENIFATFIGIVYINDGIQGMIRLWENPAVAGDSTRVPESQYGSQDAASKLLTLTLRCKFCHEEHDHWIHGANSVAEYPAIVQALQLQGSQLPDTWQEVTLKTPSRLQAGRLGLRNQHLFPVTFIDTGSSGFNSTSGRAWVTDLTSISAKGVACAALAAFPVVVFFYLDQNISSSLCQKPEMKLSKGSYFHSSFACMASRIGLPLLAPSLLQSVPKAAVFGTLIFVGIDGIQSTQLYERCLLMFTDARFVPKRSVFASVACWMVNTYFGLYFPLFFMSLAPFRRFLIPLVFSEKDLQTLDHSLDEADQRSRNPCAGIFL